MTTPPLIPRDALPAWRELAAALARVRTPCQAAPDDWFGGDVEAAVEACQSCPARVPCDRYATAAREGVGVWGGRDRTPPTTRRRRKAAA